MQSSFYRRTLPKLIFALVALTVGVFLSRGQIPVADATFTANTTAVLSSNAAGANANTTFDLQIASGDSNFSAVINSTPAAATVAPGPGAPGFNAATHPDLGEVVGTLTSASTLGLTNNPCATAINVTFTFLNATVDITDTIDPVPQLSTQSGSGGTLDNMWDDNGASNTGPGALAPWNAAWPGMDAGELNNGIPAHVEEYPSYLNEIFTPDGGAAVQPLARYTGASNVAATSVMLDLVIFGPDVLANAFPAPHPFNDTKGLGYTSIAVLNNPVAEAAPSSITDFCSPLGTVTTINGLGRVNPCLNNTAAPCNSDEGISKPAGGANTQARYANPAAAGTHLWVSLHQSLRDADGDGKENAFDPCPTTSDTFNHRTGAGADADTDGIPDACDTNPNGDADSDTDGWQNRGDNCPQASNATNVEGENAATQLAAANRGGPKTDSMGDPCDPNPGVGNGVFETTVTVSANCIGNVDADGDGWCANAGPASPTTLNDPNDASGAATPEDYDLVFAMGVAQAGSGPTPPMRQPLQVCNDGIDNDGDGLIDNLDRANVNSSCRPDGLLSHPQFPACPQNGCANIDTDGDGLTDEVERHIGTDPLGRCEVGAVPARSTDWGLDFVSGGIPNSTDKIVITDLTSFLAPTRRLDTSPGDPNFDIRWDLVPGPGFFANWIVINDLTALIAGASGFPPMFSGAKAFGGAVCTAHPVLGD